jgi:hypothetical protein
MASSRTLQREPAIALCSLSRESIETDPLSRIQGKGIFVGDEQVRRKEVKKK